MGCDWLSSQRFSWKNLLKHNYFQQTLRKIFAVWNWGHVRPGHSRPSPKQNSFFFLAFAGNSYVSTNSFMKNVGSWANRYYQNFFHQISKNLKFQFSNHGASVPIKKGRRKKIFRVTPPPLFDILRTPLHTIEQLATKLDLMTHSNILCVCVLSVFDSHQNVNEGNLKGQKH